MVARRDGLVRPLNAPPGVSPAAGVQPGVSTGVEYARIVIVFGPAGAVSGVFVYPAGTTPGAGNAAVESVSNASKDPYGNAIHPGIMSQVPGGAWVSLFQGILNFQGGSQAAGTAGGNLVFSTGGEFAFDGGPISSPTSVGGTLANPTVITTDPGTAAGVFGTDWGGSGAGADGAFFTLGNDGWVTVLLDVATTGAAPSGTICDIPAGYAPTASAVCGTLNDVSVPGSAYLVSANAGATPTLQSSGVPASSGKRYAGMARYPLGAI